MSTSRRARVRSASSEPAERTRSCGPESVPPCSVPGAASTTTWAFAPPKPKLLTPATRGPGPHGRSRSATNSGEPSKSNDRFGVS
ncbi:hypothetical protein BG846_02363 [Streptomyces fradiae ATCC 10745 = DSM 40063]|uniref:Uncharacterized protein n=1 Tax=Streptomyces fradiae ATCC 10745 = DSM 40063 TaxID=1319510 RepID=A0A1Y2NYA7_STRFR|nr:hypothetical protein BG846_02363 [Streptomyces fradiae ATCC 10745 = DSM 40063]